jgi:hypothetical protein
LPLHGASGIKVMFSMVLKMQVPVKKCSGQFFVADGYAKIIHSCCKVHNLNCFCSIFMSFATHLAMKEKLQSFLSSSCQQAYIGSLQI